MSEPAAAAEMAGSCAEDSEIVGKTDTNVDKFLNFEKLCAYLKLYHARCRCILVFADCCYEELEAQNFYITDAEAAKQQLNPFLKHRMLIITRDRLLIGSEICFL